MSLTETVTFSLDGHDFVELQSLLKVAGLCASGGEAKRRIVDGDVKVDGVIELRRHRKIRSTQTVEFDRQRILIA